MARVTRRNFLKTSGAGVLSAKTGGMAGILATSKAPAYAQPTAVHWLKWADFVPAGDEILRQSMLAEAEKALGFKINLETIGLNDLQARATAAIQVQAGPDIMMIFDNKAQLYADSVADVSAVCEAIGSSQGGYYDLAKANTHDGKKWIAVPYCIIGAMIAYRKSWFDEIGVTKFPETWEEYREVGRKLKPRATLSGSRSATPLATRPLLPIPTCGRGEGAKLRPTAKLSSSTRKRPSSLSSS
jgi:multiple sugar transport system substrate-binding protein